MDHHSCGDVDHGQDEDADHEQPLGPRVAIDVDVVLLHAPTAARAAPEEPLGLPPLIDAGLFAIDVDLGRDGLADGQAAGVKVGAVAKIDEDVGFVGERCVTDPVDALAAHVGEGVVAPVHPGDHVVAADAGDGAAALGNTGRTIVGTARTEVRDSRQGG